MYSTTVGLLWFTSLLYWQHSGVMRTESLAVASARLDGPALPPVEQNSL